jgi:putative hydroxymethylpyrimidine transport system ATP-binding protein
MTFTLKLQNCRLFYQANCLFDNLSLEVPAGTCTCLLGPSGVGKSSLLHAVAGIHLDAETSFMGEVQASDHQPLMNRVMLMSQQDGLLPWCDVLDNVMMGYRLRHDVEAKIIARAKILLNQAGLAEKHWHKKPKALSGGMRQRVALVRTALEDKSLWLLDEPFSALDAMTRYKMQELLASLWKNKTVLLVTHDPLEALRLADDIYVMKGSPAHLEKIDFPHSSTPRALTPELLKVQAKILTSLV